MLFGRRNPRSLLLRAKEIIWPSRGWRRAAVYFAHRVGRLPGTPYRIAAGVACGAAVSFTPFMGFHFVLAMGLALLTRGNLIASAIGTVVGNPWTFPFIWAWIYTLGRWMLGSGDGDEFPGWLTLTYIFDNPLKVLWPMTLGGIPTAIVAWFVVFYPVRSTVHQYQRARRRRMRKKIRKRRAAIVERATKANEQLRDELRRGQPARAAKERGGVGARVTEPNR